MGRSPPDPCQDLQAGIHLLTCSGGGSAKPQNPNRPQSPEHCGKGYSKPWRLQWRPQVSWVENQAPGREGAGILIVWHKSAHCSLGGVKRVQDHRRWQRHALIPLPQRFLRQVTSLGGDWRVAGFLVCQPPTPTLQEPPQVSVDQECEAFEEGY